MTSLTRFLPLLWLLVIPASTANAVRPTVPDAIARDAPIALLVDLQSGQTLYAKNASRRFIPASIAKVMSAFVAFEMIEAGDLSPGQQFALSDAAGKEWYRKGSTMFLEAGEAVPVDLLLQGITSVSANDASITLAEGAAGSVPAWVERMNAAARQLGLRNSRFGTPNGWPDNGQTYTTARDLAVLGQALIDRHPALYARYFGKPGMRHNGFAQANHDPISGRVEGADGIKTGYTGEAGHGFLGSAERNGTRLVMVIAAIDEDAARARIARDLIEWGFDGFERQQLFGPGERVGFARVQDGEAAMVPLTAANDIIVALPKSDARKVVLNIVYEGPLAAPIRKGSKVAQLEIAVEGMESSTIPLLAGDDIAEAGFFTRIGNAFRGWFG